MPGEAKVLTLAFLFVIVTGLILRFFSWLGRKFPKPLQTQVAAEPQRRTASEPSTAPAPLPHETAAPIPTATLPPPTNAEPKSSAAPQAVAPAATPAAPVAQASLAAALPPAAPDPAATRSVARPDVAATLPPKTKAYEPPDVSPRRYVSPSVAATYIAGGAIPTVKPTAKSEIRKTTEPPWPLVVKAPPVEQPAPPRTSMPGRKRLAMRVLASDRKKAALKVLAKRPNGKAHPQSLSDRLAKTRQTHRRGISHPAARKSSISPNEIIVIPGERLIAAPGNTSALLSTAIAPNRVVGAESGGSRILKR